jgi:hypothetical protein
MVIETQIYTYVILFCLLITIYKKSKHDTLAVTWMQLFKFA